MPRFSVIMPCRDAEETLVETLSSLMKQEFRDWSAIIVDDGSADGTLHILAEAAARDERISVMRTGGVGPSKARNLAAEAAGGEWLAFLDADDVWPLDRLSVLAGEIAGDAAAGAFYGECAFFADDPSLPTARSNVKAGALSVADVLGENPTCTMSNLVVRGDLWKEVGGLDAEMVHAEDLDLLIRLVSAGARIEGIARTLTFYRTSQHGLSADLEAMERGWRACAARARDLGVADDRMTAGAEARQLRYLARRALRLGAPGAVAARFALRGAMASPAAFFSDIKRGGATFLAALAAPLTPRTVARALYAR